MLIAGPATGLVACAMLLLSGASNLLLYGSCGLFAVYWAIVPGGVVGYTGAVYGPRTLGRIWGLATMIVVAIGPVLGSSIGGALNDLTGRFTGSMLFALGAFLSSILLASTLPLRAGEPR